MQVTDLTSIEELREFLNKGKQPEYFFFWGHTPKVPGKVDQSCLSNWYPAKFLIEEIEYPTSEHYMMAQKARLFHDEEMFRKIVHAKSPGEAKKLGRKVADFQEETWKAHRFAIVVNGNEAKFTQNPELRDFLLQTGDKVIVEASPRDRVWGIGMGKSNENASNPWKWRGLNLLGFALMEVRKRLQ